MFTAPCYNIGMDREYAGVFPSRKKDGSIYYRASVTFKRKHISLGSFGDASSAHLAYVEAGRLLSDPSAGILEYSKSSPLAFEKWVSLINFRDNGLYIANPIYIYKKMFSYYLSPDQILKFDAEELFYYSSHKIMVRGGHYFAADYGSQVNILNRYGIRSHAVEGRDYIFKNGDTLDFRLSNIEIINRYTGVSKKIKKGRTYYRAVIHINGNFIVGDYESETEAAIAYNKAADLLKLKGLSRSYQHNYIENLSPEEYNSIYRSVDISVKIRTCSL